MKKLPVLFVVIVVVLGLHSVSPSAQVVNTWQTFDQCVSAENRQPYHSSVKRQRPLAKNEKVVPLPSAGCFQTALPEVLGRIGIVWLEAGQLVGINKDTGQIVWFEECGNDIYSYQFVSAIKQEPSVVQESVIIQLPPGPKGDKGDKGDPGVSGTATQETMREKFRYPLYKPEPRFGIAVGATLGGFDSQPVDGLTRDLADRSACLTGRSFDIGVAYGKPRSSLWRVSFVGKAISNGSVVSWTCDKCKQDVQVSLHNARVWGGEVERIFRIPIFANSPVQPMVSLGAGVGWITGQATQYVVPTGTNTYTSSSSVGAGEALGSSVSPFLKVEVGALGDLGRRATFSVGVGIEYASKFGYLDVYPKAVLAYRLF